MNDHELQVIDESLLANDVTGELRDRVIVDIIHRVLKLERENVELSTEVARLRLNASLSDISN